MCTQQSSTSHALISTESGQSVTFCCTYSARRLPFAGGRWRSRGGRWRSVPLQRWHLTKSLFALGNCCLLITLDQIPFSPAHKHTNGGSSGVLCGQIGSNHVGKLLALDLPPCLHATPPKCIVAECDVCVCHIRVASVAAPTQVIRKYMRKLLPLQSQTSGHIVKFNAVRCLKPWKHKNAWVQTSSS